MPGGRALPVQEEVLDPEGDVWLRDHCPTYTVPALPMMSIVDRLAAAAARASEGLQVIEVREVSLSRWIAFPHGPRRLQTEVKLEDALHAEVRLRVWRDATRRSLSRFDEAARARVHLAESYPAAPPPLAPLDADPVPTDPYDTGELFHGPAFRLMRSLRRSSEGASFLLDATAGTVPRGLLNQGLLDGITHGIPADNLRLWSPRIPVDVVGYPARIPHLFLFGPAPSRGAVRCEARFAGFENGDQRFPQFRVQLIIPSAGADRVWAEGVLVYALYEKGPLGRGPAPLRRAFLRDRAFVPAMELGCHEAGTTTVTASDVAQSDWLPGTLAYAFDLQTGDAVAEVAAKQHVARTLHVHPSRVMVSPDYGRATCPQFPLSVFPLQVSMHAGDATVRFAAPPHLDLNQVRAFRRTRPGIPDAPIQDLYFALIERFVRRVETRDSCGFSALRGRPVIYLANHQVTVESLLFQVMVTALSNLPIRMIAAAGHGRTWFGQLIALAHQYPGLEQPEPILFCDRSRTGSLIQAWQEFQAALAAQPTSLLIDAEGRRALSCRAPVSRLDPAITDLAIQLECPIVPVCFSGGLPVEPAIEPLEFPWAGGQQDIVIGRAIEADELRPLSPGDRSRRVIEAIHRLAPPEEYPLPPNPRFPAPPQDSVAVLAETLHLAPEQGTLTRALLAGRSQEPAVLDGWLRTFSTWLAPKDPPAKLLP